MLPIRAAPRFLALASPWAAIAFISTFAAFAAPSGEEVYCSACHDQANPRIPPRDSLQKISASRILKVLDFGAMMQIAYQMTREEREAVAKFLGTAGGEASLPPKRVLQRPYRLHPRQVQVHLERLEPEGR